MANWKTGEYSREAKTSRRALRAFVRLDRLRREELERLYRRVLKRQRAAEPRPVQIAFLAEHASGTDEKLSFQP